MRRWLSFSNLASIAIIAASAAVIAVANHHDARRRERAKPAETLAAVQRADMLLREARVTGNAGLAFQAEDILKQAMSRDRDSSATYDARRLLGSVHLSQHRFRDAIAVAEKNRQERPSDPVNYGVIGDGHVELGEYTEAFNAFDRMMSLRPSASAYARVAYALELQGKLEPALAAMTLAVDATAPTDREGLAWVSAQVGELDLQLGRTSDARAAFTRASHAYPGHPFAVIGYAKVLVAEGDSDRALHLLEDLQKRTPTPDVAARIGDILVNLGRQDEAERQFSLAEAAWRSDAPEPKNLARFLATHDRKLDEAVAIAEGALAQRNDIFTNDALAWAYYKTGRIADARTMIDRALRTGSRDSDILAHADAIRRKVSVVQVAHR